MQKTKKMKNEMNKQQNEKKTKKGRQNENTIFL